MARRISYPTPRSRLAALALGLATLAIGATSCVPGSASIDVDPAGEPRRMAPESAIFAAATEPAALVSTGDDAVAANAAIPLAPGFNPAAASFIFAGRTPLDRLRAMDCLAEAVYYEARSESEDGQRAVAQVVLNRVRHPSWPNSVCGVVYQGPMRPGGGCQFTFTCDGSLALRPHGMSWARARSIAAEALAGRTFGGVGLSTHYHTHEVLPFWAHRLPKTAVIGAHNFYRLPGAQGGPTAFAAAYAGSEPMPMPSMRLPVRGEAAALPVDLPALVPAAATAAEARAAVRPASDIPADPRWEAANLPESTVREEYRQSGQWRADAPAAVTGRR